MNLQWKSRLRSVLQHRILRILLIFVLLCAAGIVLYSPLRRMFCVSSEPRSSFLVWSSGDCNGVRQISGMRAESAIGENDVKTVYPIESLNDGTYTGLTYPFQLNDTLYYTAFHVQTGENCILRKQLTEPELILYTDPQNGAEYQKYLRNCEWEQLVSGYDKILHKRVTENALWYLTESSDSGASEIRRFLLDTGEEIVAVENVHPSASFDVRADGALLYVNVNNSIILYDGSAEQELGNGLCACFLPDGGILTVTEEGMFRRDSAQAKPRRICRTSGNSIMLSPSSAYAAVCERRNYKNMDYDVLYVVDLATGRTEEITSAPPLLYGTAWFSGCYPIS